MWLKLIFLVPILVRFVPLVIDHNLGNRIWSSLAQHFITQVMIYNLGQGGRKQIFNVNSEKRVPKIY